LAARSDADGSSDLIAGAILPYGAAMTEIPILVGALMLAALPVTVAQDVDLAQVREADAIDCRLDVPAYQQFAMALEGEEHLAKQRGWKKIASANPLLMEFQLPAPITVAGTYSTRRIAFSADSILAVLDVADPAVIAGKEQIANTMDPDPMIAALVASGKVSRGEAERMITFRKFLGERVMQETTEPAPEKDGFGSRLTVARTISNSTSHPGKTFYGCSYRMQVLDSDGKPL
jgi:hypothetical protein